MFSKEIMKDEETHRRESLSEKSFQKSQITNKKLIRVFVQKNTRIVNQCIIRPFLKCIEISLNSERISTIENFGRIFLPISSKGYE